MLVFLQFKMQQDRLYVLHNVQNIVKMHKNLHITKTIIDSMGHQMSEADFIQLCGEYLCYIAKINNVELSFDLEYRTLFNYYLSLFDQVFSQ